MEWLGRINRWKGQKLFVDAAEIVHMKMPDIVFKIAGEAYKGEEYLKEDLIQYIKQKNLENVVVLLGQVDNMDEFYNSIDIFVLPSTQPEPFGLVIIEAMEFELPVIATNHGGPVEIIDNEINGFLVDYNNPIEMAEKIIELLKNKEKRIAFGENGKKKRQKLYSVNSMVKNIEIILNHF